MIFGLNDKEVNISRNKYGTNTLKKHNSNSFIKLVIASLGDPIIKILLIALGIKIVVLFKNFDLYETIGILIAVFLASFISSISEYGSNKIFEKMTLENNKLKSKVYRNGKLIEIPFEDIVVGDYLKVSSGDRIGADGHLIMGNISVNESFLSGESNEVFKEKSAKVFASSVVYKGDAVIVVDKVGNQTFMGDISLKLQDQSDESPLRGKLHKLAKDISLLGYIGAFLAGFAFLFMKIVVENNFDVSLIIRTIKNVPLMIDYVTYVLTLCVSIIIMAVPEGLPMMITLVLSSNMKKMLNDNVLVRKLVGIETSGSLNVLLCDKTGTLTEGKLSLYSITTMNGHEYKSLNEMKTNKCFDVIKRSLILNNEAIIVDNTIIGGNATDRAIISFFNESSNEKVSERETFSSENKYSYVKVNNIYYYKGASEVLLPKCKYYLNQDGNEVILDNYYVINNMIQRYMENGYRVLINAFGSKKDELTFISIIVIADKIRSEAKKSIEQIKNAGIKVVMITGDSEVTAKIIAKKLSLLDDSSIILNHDKLGAMDDETLLKKAPYISVIARALPDDKARLVRIYKKMNKVVGMTGDGVNDAIALKQSDVGFALGSGQEVAKEAADIVILDNNILSISKAILYGRTIYKSIRKFIIYQLTVNICALTLSIIGPLIGIITPITIIQMLWLNMIMDTFAGLAFSYEVPLDEYMEEKPKVKNEPIMNKYMLNQIIVNGLYSSLICFLFLKLPIIQNIIRIDQNNRYFMTAFFALFIFLGIINSFLSRTHRLNLLARLLKNKVFIIINISIIIFQMYILYYGGDIFRTYGLTLKELLFVAILSLSIIPIDFIRKIILKKKGMILGT